MGRRLMQYESISAGIIFSLFKVQKPKDDEEEEE